MPTLIDRRNFLCLSLALPTTLLLKGCGGGDNNTIKSGNLAIPKQLTPSIINGKKIFNLEIKTGEHAFFNEQLTNTYCIDEINSNDISYLAPTLRIENGDAVEINFTNRLAGENTTMHGHGMHVPGDMDGGVHQIITPNNTWTASYTVNQKACTNWYHPHLMGTTARQVYKGLAGLIIIDDANSKMLDLPKTYGVDDIPLIIQDKNFTSGQINYSPSRRDTMHGLMGDTFMVNGVINPSISVEAKQIRFRLLNASNARVYNFSLGGNNFTQIASDNAFLEEAVTLTSLKLSPAERAEIVVDFSSNFDTTFLLTDINTGKTILTITVDRVMTTPTPTTTMPIALTTLVSENIPSAAPRTFVLGRTMGMNGNFTINGVSMNRAVINQMVPINTVEIWEIVNPMNMVHNFHIHATHFRIIERNNSVNNVPDNEKGYKDTVRLDGNSSVKFVVKMTDYTTDNTAPYMFHCHILEHEDDGMMGQFTVIG